MPTVTPPVYHPKVEIKCILSGKLEHVGGCQEEDFDRREEKRNSNNWSCPATEWKLPGAICQRRCSSREQNAGHFLAHLSESHTRKKPGLDSVQRPFQLQITSVFKVAHDCQESWNWLLFGP